jgi:hypothetical protein
MSRSAGECTKFRLHASPQSGIELQLADQELIWEAS